MKRFKPWLKQRQVNMSNVDRGSAQQFHHRQSSTNTTPWPEICPSVAGMNNPEGITLRRLGNVPSKALLDASYDDPLGAEQQRLLCGSCASLQLTAFMFIPRPLFLPDALREEYELLSTRVFTEFQREPTCPLCRLIVHAIETSCDAKKITVVNKELLLCAIMLVKFSCYQDHEMDFESFRFLSVKCALPGQPFAVEYGDVFNSSNWAMESTPSGIRSVVSADLVPVDSTKYPNFFIGREVDSSISTQMVRRWLHQCEIVHGEKCARFEASGSGIGLPASPLRNATRFNTLLPFLYFIDTQENRLSRLSAGGRYVALSYVWGKCPSLQAFRDTINELQQPGSLLAAKSKLSAVIVDAMYLTADIGERYLWVDSLCIVQDDQTTKQATINMMNLVYGNAILTIIAATGTDASAGLPGVRSRPRLQPQESAVIAPNLKLVSLHSLETLGASTWSTRAWTYQEYLLSPRRLIFINGQIVFKCGWDSPCREDILSEYQIFGMEDYVFKLPYPKFGELPEIKAFKNHAIGIHLPKLVGSFTRRKLSYQSDVLNAFAGIADTFAHDCGSELCYGLVKSAMTYSMLWHPVQPFNFNARRTGFPSWSWSGWIGEVIAHDGTMQIANWTATHSWIDWYIFDEKETVFHLLPQKHSEPVSSSAVSQTILPGIPALDTTSSMFERVTSCGQVESGPQYLDFLRKHPDSSRSNPADLSASRVAASILVQELRPSSVTADLNSHALFFRTLITIAHISPYDPEGHYQQHDQSHAYIYDSKGRHLGVGFITHLALWSIAFGDSASIPPLREKYTLQMAILAGPVAPQQTNQGSIGSGVIQVSPTSATFTHYHVLLLTRRIPSTTPMYEPVQNYYERAGIGVISSDAVETMEGLNWEDIIMQ